MLEGGLREEEEEARSEACLPGGGVAASAWEDLDLRVSSRGCLAGEASLAAGLEGERAGGGLPFSGFSFSSGSPLPAALAEPAFLESMAVLPRSADRRVSFWRRADLKKERPLSSDLLSLFRPE